MPTISFGKKPVKANQRRAQQRALMFPDVQKEELWTNPLKGWSWVPRTMPLVLHSIRALSKGSNAAETYFGLWCHSMSHSIVEMSSKANLIASAGYTGSTSERTWKERMKKLEELGFIKIASGKHGDISCVLILNPHLVLRKHKRLKTPGFDEKIYNCILEQIAEFGMRDFEESEKKATQPVVPVSPNPTVASGAPVTNVAK